MSRKKTTDGPNPTIKVTITRATENSIKELATANNESVSRTISRILEQYILNK